MRPILNAAEGSVTPFQALATALAPTVGVGNSAGVSTAISLGGPRALFWLLVSGVPGIATKFFEIAVSLNYRLAKSPGKVGTRRCSLKRGARPREQHGDRT